ncbi:hypothetical protein GOV10_02610, partial [Candidatus Woesearchaeota archaeon]|nr:hypothetical protein [Candidatus Woesearchaeota archaeon]
AVIYTERVLTFKDAWDFYKNIFCEGCNPFNMYNLSANNEEFSLNCDFSTRQEHIIIAGPEGPHNLEEFVESWKDLNSEDVLVKHATQKRIENMFDYDFADIEDQEIIYLFAEKIAKFIPLTNDRYRWPIKDWEVVMSAERDGYTVDIRAPENVVGRFSDYFMR